MATISHVASNPTHPSIERVVWETLTEADTADTYTHDVPMVSGSVTVTGTFGGATVVLQGSNDGTNWVTLTDTGGNAITGTAAYVREFVSSCLYLRPSATSGTGQDVDAIIVMRRKY